MGFLGGLKNSIKIRLLFLAGFANYWQSRLYFAEIAFKRILEIQPNHFKSHILLGKIYTLQEEHRKAAGEFLKAKEINNKKFRRYHIPPSSLEEPQWGSEDLLWNYENFIHQFRKEKESLWNLDLQRGERDLPQQVRKKNMEGGIETFGFGDFTSFQEFKKFRALPPITREDIQKTDWEKLFQNLALQ